MKDEIKITEEMQKVVEQMRLDDIEDDPTIVDEFFECDCCNKNACLAGSIQYENYRLCNDCVLLAEVGFELGKIKKIQELIDVMEDKRLEEVCEFIKRDSSIDQN